MFRRGKPYETEYITVFSNELRPSWASPTRLGTWVEPLKTLGKINLNDLA